MPPSGKGMKLRIRKEDAEHIKRLERMEDVYMLENRGSMAVFKKHFNRRRTITENREKKEVATLCPTF